MKRLESQLYQLQDKIDNLKAFARDQGIDLSSEIAALENRIGDLRTQLFSGFSPWQKVQLVRSNKRPTTLHYFETIFSNFTELHGDRLFRDDPALVGGIAYLEGVPVTILGHQKGRDTKESIARNYGMPHPEGYRKALRLMEQAAKFRRPIICFIDTPGAYPGLEAEERGQSEAIARNLREITLLQVPIISIVTGEGGSGGALALSVCDCLLMLENAIYSVISPEGCAAILWKEAGRAPEAASAMKITADDLAKMGIADEIIPEPQGGIQVDWQTGLRAVKEALARHLEILEHLPLEILLKRRTERFNRLGEWQRE